ncbi:MAG TPA: hypothetical protein VFX92_14540 [Candidatus Krumholzibacteria bacterium]|nr:hypothetical protein [Candidatus Krumholzibacteria bacterium]
MRIRTELRKRARVLCLLAATLVVGACGIKDVERRDVSPGEFGRWTASERDSVRKESPFLKAHMRNGDLFVLTDWRVATGSGDVLGHGKRYDPSRTKIVLGDFRVPVDSVAMFETNRLVQSGATPALIVMAGVTAGFAIFCAISPKTCFGSCPTFYLDDPDRPVAEGFSASIAPSLEATDVDAVYPAAFAGGPLEVTMKNEALETHVVRFVNLLAVPHARGARVFADLNGAYWECSALSPPVSAAAPGGDITAQLHAADRREYFSPADSSNLATRESIRVDFDPPAPAATFGILLGCRQTLLSTYVLYQTFAYMGTEAGHWLAELERGRLGAAGNGVVDMIGGLEVRIEAAPGEWRTVGEIREFGPIAIDHHLITFDAPAWTGRVELVMTKGGWRIDDVARAQLTARVEPLRLQPVDAARDGASDTAALAILRDTTRALTTLPGDTYTLLYDVPADGGEYDVFIESRGYYLEWIRDEWLREESATNLAEIFFDPRSAMERMAPAYKRAEPYMESAFWSSRYAKP